MDNETFSVPPEASIPDDFGDGQNVGDYPSFASPSLSSEEDPGDDDFEIEKVRSNIQKLIKENTTNVSFGRAQTVALGVPRPKHYTAADLKRAADAPISWQVKDFWTTGSKLMLASEPKAGKTWLVLSIAISMCSGGLLFDRLEVKDPGPVGIISPEDSEGEVGRRFDRMCRAHGLLMSGLDLHWWPGQDIRLNRPRDIIWIEDQVKKYGLKMIIYDPLARLMDGDENNKECVSGVLTPAGMLIKETGCTVMIVHHLGKDDPDRPKTAAQRIRGSSDLRSWYETGIFLSGKMEHGKIDIELEQRIRGNIPDIFPVRAIEVEEQSIYGRGTFKLVANLDRSSIMSGNNEILIDNAVDRIMELAKSKGDSGLSMSEITIHLRYGKALVAAALKKAIRDLGELEFEKALDIPDGKLLMLTQNSRARRQSSDDRLMKKIEEESGQVQVTPRPMPMPMPSQREAPETASVVPEPTEESFADTEEPDDDESSDLRPEEPVRDEPEDVYIDDTDLFGE